MPNRKATRAVLLAALLTTHAFAANPLLFVTQVPIPADFATVASVFGNHLADPQVAGRGGDLYIAYPDGELRNLTREAGYGTAAVFQGATSIAVRDPAVHWSGTKAVFAMAVGAPEVPFERPPYRWQLYEVTGLGKGQTARIAKVPGQPPYNNVEPTYTSEGDLVFASDRPRNGAAHLHPQVDEYESRRIVTGLWRLDAATGKLTLLQHSPSGSFTPAVNHAGRIVYTRWDHLQTDQESDKPVPHTFNYEDESAAAVATSSRAEWFPAPRIHAAGSEYEDHRFNQMFAWQINQDGTEEETLEHLGRHELLDFFPRARNDDPEVEDFVAAASGRANPNPVNFLLQLRENPTAPGTYVATDAREFEEHASGQLVQLVTTPGGADTARIEYLTPRATYCCHDPIDPLHTGHYRNPLWTSDGRLLAVHTPYRGTATNLGTRAAPRSPFDFRIKTLVKPGAWYEPGTPLTPGLTRSVQYYDPDVLVSWTGELWELSPVEVVARPAPPVVRSTLRAQEATAFQQEAVDPADFRAFLAEAGLGLIVVRDATRRDDADEQQPYNLAVPGGVSSQSPHGGRSYDIARLQVFQADLVRGATDRPGRRALARPVDVGAFGALNQFEAPVPASVPIYPDGSAALLVPAQRALSWQSLSPQTRPVVQERYWITLQPGEIRACDGCHGVNGVDQAGRPAAENVPQALSALLARWKTQQGRLFDDGFEAPP